MQIKVEETSTRPVKMAGDPHKLPAQGSDCTKHFTQHKRPLQKWAVIPKRTFELHDRFTRTITHPSEFALRASNGSPEMRISLSQRWEASMKRIVPLRERITTEWVFAPQPK